MQRRAKGEGGQNQQKPLLLLLLRQLPSVLVVVACTEKPGRENQSKIMDYPSKTTCTVQRRAVQAVRARGCMYTH